MYNVNVTLKSSSLTGKIKEKTELHKSCTMRISTCGVLCIHREDDNRPVKFYPEGTWLGAEMI